MLFGVGLGVYMLFGVGLGVYMLFVVGLGVYMLFGVGLCVYMLYCVLCIHCNLYFDRLFILFIVLLNTVNMYTEGEIRVFVLYCVVLN